MVLLTEVEAGQVVGGQPGLQMELLSEKDRVRIVRALRAFLEVNTSDLDQDAIALLMKLANPDNAVWVQKSVVS